jgi:WD40 repeat protein
MTTLNLPPPSFYKDKLNYASQWSEYQNHPLQPQLSSITIFDLAFGSNEILIACTSTGELCFFQLTHVGVDNEENGYEDDNLPDNPPKVANANICFYRFQLTKGSLYTLKIQRDTENTWLIVGGDGGVWLLDWNDVQDVRNDSSSFAPPKHHHFPLHPSPRETAIEVNDTCFQNGCLFGAAGDDFGCYKWDVTTGKLITTYPSKFLQTMTLVPNTNLLLTGGEEGVLNLWDIQQDRRIDQLEIPDLPSKVSTNQTEKRGALLNRQTRLTCSIARDENWWTIGGERIHTRNTRQQSVSDKRGFLATFHGPTRSIVSQLELRETPQKLAFVDNNKNTLISVANESYVSHFQNSLALDNPERVWCHSPSVFAAAVSEHGILAVAGVGSTIDLYRNQTELIGILRL